jgi:hypothetical protein
MSEPVYVPFRSNVVSGDDFINSVVFDEACGDKPAYPRSPKIECYCDNRDCAVREVTVAAVYYGDVPQTPPAMHCPACGKLLRFENYLAEPRLLRVDR